MKSRTPSHFASLKFWRPLNELCHMLANPVCSEPGRFVCPGLILKDTDREETIVSGQDAIIRNKSWPFRMISSVMPALTWYLRTATYMFCSFLRVWSYYT